MILPRRLLLGATAALPFAARAQASALKIGVLTDMTGPYRDAAGPVSVAAVQQAVEEGGMAAAVVSADHQNKPDVAAGIARQWFDQDGVDLIVNGISAACGLAIAGVAKEKNKVYIGNTAADLTGPQCNANTLNWSFDTYMLAKSTGGALVKTGGTTWFFITADYAFGHAIEKDATGFITAAGGKVLGAVSYPFPSTTDFSSALLQAQASGAQVIGLASAGVDFSNQVKQAAEFGIMKKGIIIAGLGVYISDVNAIGLDIAQGLVFTDSFYWDTNDRTRAFAARLQPKAPGVRPGFVHAGDYAAVVHYLKAAKAMGADARKDGAATVARMKAMPTDDDAFGPGSIREDGRVLHPAYLWKVKSPAESKGAWDYYKPVAVTPADQAFRPLKESTCPLVHT